MPEYWITYETTATLMFRVQAESEEAAQERWQNEAPFDFDHGDFADGAAGTDGVELRRLEMLGRARNFDITEVRKPSGAARG
jgi:hypothetical protein